MYRPTLLILLQGLYTTVLCILVCFLNPDVRRNSCACADLVIGGLVLRVITVPIQTGCYNLIKIRSFYATNLTLLIIFELNILLTLAFQYNILNLH